MKFCLYCGTQLDSGDMFCTACGKSISNIKESTGQQSPNTNAPPIPPQSQQYTPPVPPPYHPGASSSQNFASPGAPQPRPGGNNAFAQFSEEMNTGNIQKRTGGRGMLLGGIIGLVVLAIIISGIIIALRPKDSSGRNDDNPKDNKSSSATIEKDNDTAKDKDNKKSDKENSSKTLPDNVKTDAQLSDIVGYWEGTILFTRMEGFENIPAEDLPPDLDMKEAIAEIMASPAPMVIEFEEDGNWELDIDIMDGMLMGSRDYEREEYDSSPLIIKKLDNGSFNVEFSEKVDEDGISGEAKLNLIGSVVEKDGELSIVGTFLITMTQRDIVITEEGEYTVFPQE